jgi:hypothetical protein
MASSYQMFVKEHIHQFKHLPAKERMKAVAELYPTEEAFTEACIHEDEMEFPES